MKSHHARDLRLSPGPIPLRFELDGMLLPRLSPAYQVEVSKAQTVDVGAQKFYLRTQLAAAVEEKWQLGWRMWSKNQLVLVLSTEEQTPLTDDQCKVRCCSWTGQGMESGVCLRAGFQ